MSEMDVYAVESKPATHKINIQYRRPKTFKRVFARIVDLLLLVVVGILLFLGLRAIVNSTEASQAALKRIDDAMVESGVYVLVDGKGVDRIQYLDNQTTLSDRQRMESLQQGIEMFFEYAEKEASAEDFEMAVEDYDSFRLSLSFEGTPLFVRNLDSVVRNPEADFGSETYRKYSELCYEPFLDEHVRGYLVTICPQYLADTRYFSNMILYVELPISVFVACVLVYFVPPLFLWRNRQTLGMLLYRIGMADNRLLCVSFKRFLAYEAIFIFGIIGLSFLTLGIPLIVSTTLMAFTAEKQDFPEYMLRLHEIDVSSDKIYKDYAEIQFENSRKSNRHVNFRNITGEE